MVHRVLHPNSVRALPAAFLEQDPSGRLLRWDHTTGEVDVALEHLDFPNGLTLAPNGLTLAPDGHALVLVETAGYRISRIELDDGGGMGAVGPVATDLPGFPDNLSSFHNGRAWVAFTNPRSNAVDDAGRMPGWLRTAIWNLVPQSWLPGPRDIVWLRSITDGGHVVGDIHTTELDFEMATGAAEFEGRLYVAGLQRSALLRLDL